MSRFVTHGGAASSGRGTRRDALLIHPGSRFVNACGRRVILREAHQCGPAILAAPPSNTVLSRKMNAPLQVVTFGYRRSNVVTWWVACAARIGRRRLLRIQVIVAGAMIVCLHPARGFILLRHSQHGLNRSFGSSRASPFCLNLTMVRAELAEPLAVGRPCASREL
jgi:hypothetical protein